MYKLSNLAAEDFAAIYEHTLLNFGALQADTYTDELDRALQLLSGSPLMGYECSKIADQVRRQDHQKHIIFYRLLERGIFVIRVFHQQMDPWRHLFEL